MATMLEPQAYREKTQAEKDAHGIAPVTLSDNSLNENGYPPSALSAGSTT
jgi:hypothetical protein